MSENLLKLIEGARRVQMTPEQIEAQRISFAYGSANLTDDYITREDVAKASRRLKEHGDEQPAGPTRPPSE